MLDLCSSWVSHLPPELEARALAGKRRKERKEEEEGGDRNRNRDQNRQGQGRQGQGKEEGKEEEEEEEEATLQILGLGINAQELSANPILTHTLLRDLNAAPPPPTASSSDGDDEQPPPPIPASFSPLHATVCAVSIDYLTRPVAVLSSVRERTVEGGSVHLVVSNRCFPTKAVGRWLRVGEEERLRMVGDYLWWSGWRRVEIVEVCDGRVREGEGGRGGGGGGLAGWMGMFRGGVDPLWVVRGVKVAQEEGGTGTGEEKKSEL